MPGRLVSRHLILGHPPEALLSGCHIPLKRLTPLHHELISLVIIGATPEGKKKLFGFTDGRAETKKEAVAALEAFIATYQVKYERAADLPDQGQRRAAGVLRLPGRALEVTCE